jgi:hypothetical protein
MVLSAVGATKLPAFSLIALGLFMGKGTLVSASQAFLHPQWHLSVEHI